MQGSGVYSSAHPTQAAAHRAPPHVTASPSPAAGAPAAAAPDVRDTVEYRAAWDLELWKAVQADRFRKQLEKQHGVAVADLARSVRQREKMAKEEVAQRTAAVAAREEAVKAAEVQLAARQAKTAEAEREVRRMRQQLMDAQQRVEDEVRAQVRLANDTIAHRARLLEERVKAAEGQAKRADERQRQSQEEYLALYEAFSRYRTQQLTSTSTLNGGGGGGGLLAVSSTAATSSALGPAFQLEQLRAQWDAEQQLQLDRQAQRHRAELATVQERCRELEEQNRRLSAALARRREQLRHIKASGAEAAATQASPSPAPPHGEENKGKGIGTISSAGASPAPPAGTPLPASVPDAATREVVERLVRELHRLGTDRVSLVEGSGGAVRETDAVIVSMDARARDLQRQLAAVQGTAGGGGAEASSTV